MQKHTLDDLPDHIDKNHITFTSTDDIKKMIKPLLEKWGIDYFSHVISYRNGYATALVTNVDVAIHWVAEQYFWPWNNGPRILSGIYFVPYLDNLPYKEILSKLFHVDNILMIVEAYKDRDEFFSFGTKPDNRKIINCYFNNLDVFKRFIANYKIQGKPLIKLAIKTRAPMPLSIPIEMDVGALSDTERKAILEQVTPKRIPIGNGKYLTARELDCLLLCTEGKSAKATARIMSISSRTVETYLENAKGKLECHRKSELLDKFLKIAEYYHLR